MLQHVSIEVPRSLTADHVRFWRALGFERVDPPGSLGERSTWFARSGTQIHLLHTDDPVVPPQGHVAVVAEPFDATLDALRAEGFEPEERTQHWGVPRWFVRGPGGHLVEVMAAPPPAP